MKIRKWKSSMTVGNEKLFKCANYFGHIKTHKRSSWRGAMVWRGEGSAAAAAGQTEWSIEMQSIFFNFETISQHAKQWREILSFFCGFCESKSLQFKAFYVCAAINCEYLQPSPPTPVRAPWPCSRTQGPPLCEPWSPWAWLRLMRDPELMQFPWHIHNFRINFNLCRSWHRTTLTRGQRATNERPLSNPRSASVWVGGTAHRRGHESVKMCNCRHELIRQSSSRTLSTRGRTRTATQTEIRGGQRGRVWRSFRIVPIA